MLAGHGGVGRGPQQRGDIGEGLFVLAALIGEGLQLRKFLIKLTIDTVLEDAEEDGEGQCTGKPQPDGCERQDHHQDP